LREGWGFVITGPAFATASLTGALGEAWPFIAKSGIYPTLTDMNKVA
jgi:hypothetical protein